MYGASCTPGVLRDDFNGNALGAPWSVVRPDGNLVVNNGAVTIPTAAGDLYHHANTAKNVVLRPAPTGALTVTTKLNHKGTTQYQQGGIIVYGDDDNYIKLDRTSTNTAGDDDQTEFIEFVQEVAGAARNGTADHTPTCPRRYAADMWLRIVYDGTNLIGQYSSDGTHLDATPASPRRRCRRTRRSASSPCPTPPRPRSTPCSTGGRSRARTCPRSRAASRPRTPTR